MSWLTRARKGINLFTKSQENGAAVEKRPEIPENLWNKCPSCGDLCYHKELAQNLWVCYQCGYHYPIDAMFYFTLLFDAGSFEETHKGLVSLDPLDFRDGKRYRDRIKESRAKTGREDAVICALGRIEGMPVSMAVMDFKFIGGSMGSVVGEKLTQAIERATAADSPRHRLLLGRRPHAGVGVLSLMQMAKTSAALARLADDGRALHQRPRRIPRRAA
jgi:acetyl-CoA carboxylase carboxyl transferase subunit beta